MQGYNRNKSNIQQYATRRPLFCPLQVYILYCLDPYIHFTSLAYGVIQHFSEVDELYKNFIVTYTLLKNNILNVRRLSWGNNRTNNNTRISPLPKLLTNNIVTVDSI